MKTKTLVTGIVFFTVLLLGGLRTEASMDLFLRITGLPGESRDATHTNEIDVLAWSWGMTNSGTMHLGSGGGAGKVSIQDLSITKYVDKASPILMLYACKGTQFVEVELTVRTSGGAQPVEILKIKLTDVIVSSLSTGGSGGEDRLVENVSFNFAEVNVSYVPVKQNGSPDTPVLFNWNIPANTEN